MRRVTRPYRFTDGRPTRQDQVVALRAQGLDNVTIAERLGITRVAVNAAVQNARRNGVEVPRLRAGRKRAQEGRAA